MGTLSFTYTYKKKNVTVNLEFPDKYTGAEKTELMDRLKEGYLKKVSLGKLQTAFVTPEKLAAEKEKMQR